ncbi:SHOCT domain-containing protein [Kribbella solani]|uniref:SHOCT domain-containing protein n=1 Tax=Kribbella solani TaxID=236067 RepID=UPI0029B2759C|nr:SHOCT domain-containing protein [Kribbella solani]MDX3005053.1 SHOCT domain-containing protein [Kribbella solani]
MMNSAADAVFWSVIMVVLWLLIVGGAGWVTVRMIRQSRRHPPVRLPSPLDILERRFAAGELTQEQFDDARARLREHELDI